VLPPTGKKGLKPFLAGMEPRYQASYREEVLGEPFTKEEVPETDAEQAGRHMQTLRAGRSRCCLPGLMSSVSESSIPSGTCSGDDDAAASWRNIAADAAPGRGGAETWLVRRRRASAEEGWFFWGDLVGEKKSSAAAAARSTRRQQRRTTRKPERRGRAGRQAGAWAAGIVQPARRTIAIGGPRDFGPTWPGCASASPGAFVTLDK